MNNANSMHEDQESMLKELMMLDFKLLDLQLYLDTHPDDMNSISAYNNLLVKAEALRKAYQEKYGPLTVNYPVSDTWKWINNPWPWNKMEV